MSRVCPLALALTLLAAAPAGARPLLLVGPLDDAATAGLSSAAAHGFDPVTVAPADSPTAEQALAAARPLYRDMAFGRAAQRLQADETAMLQDHLPSPEAARALAELEVWLGAFELLGGRAADAADHFALARTLDPRVEPDPIFPPEVRTALVRAAGSPVPQPVAVKLAPAGARLWLDGAFIDGPLAVTPGLHWVVVERADRRPFARVLRVSRAAPQIAVSLDEPAAPALALRQAAARVQSGPLGADEGLGVARSVGRPLVIVTSAGIDRYDAADPARAVAHAEGPPTVDALCRLDRSCDQPAETQPPRRAPWYKRAAFWAPVGVGVALVVGGAVALSLLANNSSDYVARVH